jgi:hypothetical protein
MGTLEQMSKWTHEAGEWIWKVAGSPDAKDTLVVNEPPQFAKGAGNDEIRETRRKGNRLPV